MHKNLKAGLLILILTLVIMGVEWIYQGGTIFLLDYISYPVESLSVSFWKNTLSHFVFEGGMWLLGHALFSKLFFFLTIFASGRLGYRFAQMVIKLFALPSKYETPLLISGIFLLLFNPVLYERMITQPGVYAAMVLLGYGLLYLLKTISTSKLSHFILAGIFFGLSVSFSAHMVFMLGLVSFLYLLFFLRSKKIGLGLLILALMTILPNINWLIGGFLGEGAVVTDTISTFNQANIQAFLSNALPPFNLELTNLMLYGFWGERFHFLLPEDVNPLWWIFSLILLIGSVGGHLLFSKKYPKEIGFLILCGIGAWIFGCGVSSDWFGGLNQWLFDNIPYYIGLREPQKWIGLLLFPWSIGILLAMSQLLKLLDELRPQLSTQLKKSTVVLVVAVLLLATTPQLLGVFHGQLTLTDYPASYQVYKSEFLPTDLKKGKILILPRHSYLRCSRNDKVIANPFRAYLGSFPQIITADNIEMSSLYTNSSSPQSQAIENFLQTRDLASLKQHGITTILMMEKCADYQNYAYLTQLSGLQKLFSAEELTSYTIK